MTLTVEKALNGLNVIASSYPNSLVASKALALTEEIISRQIDTVLPAKDS